MTIRIGAILAAAVLLAGCGGGGGGDKGGGGGNVVKYTDSGWDPSRLTIKSGDTVTVENHSSEDAWPGANNHPTHPLYKGFDAKKPLLQGHSYSFPFTKAGS